MNEYQNVLRLLNWKNEEYKSRLKNAIYEQSIRQTEVNKHRVKHYRKLVEEYQQAIEVLEREGESE